MLTEKEILQRAFEALDGLAGRQVKSETEAKIPENYTSRRCIPEAPAEAPLAASPKQESTPAEVLTDPTQEQIDAAGRILAQAGMRLMELNGVVTVGIWRDQDTAAVRTAIGLFHPDGVPIRYLDDPDILAKYKSGRVQPSEPATLKGEAVELWRDGRRFFLVADEEDAQAALKAIGASRGEVWTSAELELVASIPDQATRDEVESFKRQMDGTLSPGAAGKCISAAEWQAQMLNQLFKDQGVLGEPAKITAKTVQHGERGRK